MKTFKEYTGVSGIRVGGIDSVHPIASLGDKPPKGKGSRAPRAIGLNANKEYDLKDKALYYKLVRQAMSVMPGSQKQKQIKKEIERVQKRLGIKEDKNRIPRKPGQKAGSDKHSDLYTDENPKGTIHGLGVYRW